MWMCRSHVDVLYILCVGESPKIVQMWCSHVVDRSHVEVHEIPSDVEVHEIPSDVS